MSKSTYCTLYIARHGQTQWNVKGKMQGHKDSPLTPTGIKQAKDLGKKLSQIPFAAVFASDLLRASRTAQLIMLEHQLTIQTTKLLRERNFGKHEGKTLSEIQHLFDVFNTLGESAKFKHQLDSDVESDEQLVARLITFLREISLVYPGKNVLIVTHAGMIRALLIHLGFANYKELGRGTIKNTAYVKLESDGVDFFIKDTIGVEKRPVI